jgi:TolA-binding protein
MKKQLSFFLLMLLPFALLADAEVDREFEFAKGLIELGFPDFAKEVVDEVVRKHPDQKSRALLLDVEVLIAARRLPDAEAAAAKLPAGDPKALAARLALANAYYAVGEREKAEGIYKDFFKQYPAQSLKDADLKRFYQDAAYRYGLMQQQVGNIGEALTGFENVLKTNPEKGVERRLKSEMADLYLKQAAEKSGAERTKAIERGKKLCMEVLYGGTDIWFGNAINTLANIQLMEGKRAEARTTLTDYMDMLSGIDDMLEEDGMSLDLSPMAGARYLLGEMNAEDAAKAAAADDKDAAVAAYGQALKQFVNVFAKYSGSRWGEAAGNEVDRITELLESDFDRTVKIDMGKYRMNAIKARFDKANQAYVERRYADAVREYLNALNAYPNTSETGRQLANLGVSFAHTGDKLAVEALSDYIVERYRRAPNAHLGLLLMGKYYFDQEDREMYLPIYNAYLDNFPKHESVPGVMYTLAMSEEKAGNSANAEKYLARLMAEHKQSPFYLRAAERQAWRLYEQEEFAAAVEFFEQYLAAATPNPDTVRVKFALADSLARMEDYNKARVQFTELAEWLRPERNPYGNTPEEIAANKETLEKAEYYIAFCIARLDAPADKLEQVRQIGMTRLREFIEKYPQSEMAPRAYNLLGKLHIELGDSAKAAEVYTELAEKYPDSSAGQGALYQLIKSASELGKTEIVDEAFGRMIANPGSYSPAQFAITGETMLDNGLYANAEQAFQQVLDSKTEERKLLERALFGLGRAKYENGESAAAVEMLTRLMETYPDSSFFYDAKFILARSNLAEGDTDQAREDLRDVFRYAQDELLRKEADYQLALIERQAGNLNRALAGFQRIALLSDPGDAELRPLMEKSLLQSIDLFNELEQFEEVIATCNQYLETFPRGASVEEVREKRRAAQLR